MNPLLQRFLVAWAAGSVTSAAIVATAEDKTKPKRRKKKKKGKPDDVQIGAQAMKDKQLLDERGMSVEEFQARIAGLGKKLTGVFTKTAEERAAERTDADGARVPDVIETKDGKKVRPPPPAAQKTKKKKGKRRKGKRREATLWDSAKESMRQTVKEAVHEEVKETPVGAAMETLKKASASIKEGASKIAGKVSETVKQEGLDEKVKLVAQKAASAVKENIDNAKRALAQDAVVVDLPAPAAPSAAPSTASVEAHDDAPAVDFDDAQPSSELVATAPPAGAVDVQPPTDAQPVDAAEVKKKVMGGIDAVGDWLKGPGGGVRAGDKDRTRRVRPSGGGEVVEAKVVDAKDGGAAPVAPKATVDVVEAKDAPPQPLPAPPQEAPAALPPRDDDDNSDRDDEER